MNAIDAIGLRELRSSFEQAMLFNSLGFLLLFIPLTVAAFVSSVRPNSSSSAVAVLLIASCVFYGFWDSTALLLLAVSTVFNYAIGAAIVQSVRSERVGLARMFLCIGVTANLCFLGYFKYVGFLIANFDMLAGGRWAVPSIVLPVGISFYTFTQIALLADVFHDRSVMPHPIRYSLFVSYFPHLVAGPIIHHKDTIPQFGYLGRNGWDTTAAAVGLSLFTIGLFKKIAIADSVAPFADSAFARATTENIPMLSSWTGALAYSFQIYFDFSGYSDMAIGLSLLFGVRLPLNFASPYKATSIIEFWNRWHMSLSQFFRNYLYIPLGGNRKGPARRYINLMITMLLGGLWHGAGWTFVVWGGLHGSFLVANHFLRQVRAPSRQISARWLVWAKRVGVFLIVTIAWVFFRADSVSAAIPMLGSMIGVDGVGRIETVPVLWLAACLFIVWALPNSYQIFAAYRPTLPVRAEIAGLPANWLAWRLNAVFATVTAVTFACCVLAINKFSPFLYFRF